MTKREIKFRAWDKKGNNMVFPLFPKHIQYAEDYTGFASGRIDDGVFEDSFELMQFTGLLDKNGKEIWEGDILRVLYTDWPSQLDTLPELSHEEYLDSLSMLGVVVFSGDRFSIDFNDGFRTRSIFEGEYGFKKVIGNIYENPELLKD